jgi:4-deoxy-L-threo-5-hexosulose-uronate ketol-isomerase
MDIRYSVNPEDFKTYTTEQIRKEFLYTNLYQADTVQAFYTHVDRVVTLGCMPVKEEVSIDKGIDIWHNFGTKFFLERREIGIFNIGGNGIITVDGKKYELANKDCLYITMGAKEVTFASKDAAKPAKFYMASTPAHRSYETRLLKACRCQSSSARRCSPLQQAYDQSVHSSRCSANMPAFYGHDST